MTLHHEHNGGIQKRFIYSIVLTALILVAEIVGGIWSNSLALLSDAAHVFSDIFALGLSYLALRIAMRPPDDQHSYGWHRAEVLAALVNGVSLLVIALGIWYEAFERWKNPLQVHSTEMMVIAIIGLAVNVAVAFILGGHDHEYGQAHSSVEQSTKKPRNLNVQSAFLHVIGDLISSVGVIIAAILIRITSAYWIDPLVSVLIGAIILVSAYHVTRKSLHILVEGVPEGMSVKKINETIRTVPAVETVHDLHIWNLNSENIALSAHVVLADHDSQSDEEVMNEIKALLASKFGIQHTTLQFENVPCGEGHGGCN